ETWENPVRLVETTYECNNPCIARDSEGNLHAALFGFAVVYVMRSGDGGTSWTHPLQLSSQSGEPLEPAIAVNVDNAIFIAWGQEDFYSDYPLYFVRSGDYGAFWSSILNIFNGWENAVDVYKPAIAADNENGIYVTWTATTGGGENYSYFNYSHDTGATWNTSDTNFGESSCSGIAAAPNGDIYVILASIQAVDIQDVLFRKSTDKGSNWSDAVEVASNLSNPAPQMGVDRAGNINVAYYDEGDERVLFRRSTDEGAAWSPVIEAVADNAADTAMTVDWWGNVYFVYVDENSGEIRFVRSNG
ncbi:MAG: exo-alpha-sialidase, partial [bacterium]|nr:exo-alpha-sialidase [bacterium]